MELSAYTIIGQGFGIIGACFSIYGMAQKNDKNLKAYSLAGNVNYIFHYYMLSNGLVGAIMGVLGIFKSYFSIKQNKYIGAALIFCYASLGIVLYDGILYILPVFAGIASAIGMFFYKGVGTRLFIMLDSIIWLIYNYWVFSIGGIIMETTLLLILAYNIIVHRNKIREVNV